MPTKGGGALRRQVMLYAKPDDPFCGEIISLLEKAGVKLRIHDLTKQPLNSVQISGLIRHNDVERFLNPYSKLYKKNELGKSLPSRQEVIDLIAGDNDLFRVPIVVSGSMISVGYDPRQIAGMLQLKPHDSENTADENTPTPVISRPLPQES